MSTRQEFETMKKQAIEKMEKANPGLIICQKCINEATVKKFGPVIKNTQWLIVECAYCNMVISYINEKNHLGSQ